MHVACAPYIPVYIAALNFHGPTWRWAYSYSTYPNISLLNIECRLHRCSHMAVGTICPHESSILVICCSSLCGTPYSHPEVFNALTLPNIRVLEVHHVGWPYEELK